MKRSTAIALAALVLASVWLWPLPHLGAPPFSAHMAAHVAVVAIAAPLLAAGLAGTRWDPAARAPRLFVAIPASILELCAVWTWHAPALHLAARRGPLAHALEQGTFLVAGVALWCAALGGGPELRRARVAEGVTSLLFTSMHMTLLGALLALTPRVLYRHETLCGAPISPLLDQQLGGAIMLFVGSVAYLAGGVWLTADALRSTSGNSARLGARYRSRGRA